jgi:hypothetical protein
MILSCVLYRLLRFPLRTISFRTSQVQMQHQIHWCCFIPRSCSAHGFYTAVDLDVGMLINYSLGCDQRRMPFEGGSTAPACRQVSNESYERIQAANWRLGRNTRYMHACSTTPCRALATLYCSVDTSGGYLSAEQGYRFRTDRKVITLKTSQWYLTRASGCKALTACRQSNLFHVVEGPRNLLPHLAAAVGFYRCDGMHIMHMRCCHATSKADYQAEMVTRRKDNRGLVRRAQYLRLHQPNTATNLLTF